MKKNKWILPSIMILLLIIATIGVTFAAFTFTKEGVVENTLETSTIMLTYTEGKTGIILSEAYPMSDEVGKVLTGTNNVFDFTVQATLGKSTVIGYEVTAVKIPITDMTPLEDDEVKLYLERAIDPDTTYEEILMPTNFIPRDTPTELGSPIGSMILDSGTFTNEGTTIHNYRLRLWVDEEAQIPNGESRKYGVKINVYAKQDVMGTPVEQPISKTNPNIKKVYVYNQETGSSTFCVTGEEDTCVSLRKAPETYSAGTIIKYQVNDTEEKYFHVMFDDGNTLTLQQRENTVNTVAWYPRNDNTTGPITALPTLEEATSTWTNVLDQPYTLGTTIFKDNAYTGCSAYNLCTTNTYVFEERTAKARMIMLQETSALGCSISNQSCPVWMYNYMNDSINNGGTISGTDYAYWTGSANSSATSGAWLVSHYGRVHNDFTSYMYTGVRAVVNIEK